MVSRINRTLLNLAVVHKLPGLEIQYLDSQSAWLLAGALDTSSADLLGYLEVSTAHSRRRLLAKSWRLQSEPLKAWRFDMPRFTPEPLNSASLSAFPTDSYW